MPFSKSPQVAGPTLPSTNVLCYPFSVCQGYLSVTVVAQLSDVILQRSYLPFMAAAFDPETTTSVPTIDEVEAPAGFWENMTLAMYARSVVNEHRCKNFLSLIT